MDDGVDRECGDQCLKTEQYLRPIDSEQSSVVGSLEENRMHIDERQVVAVVILDAVGRMTFSDGEQLFKDKIYSLIYRGRTNVVVNLGSITCLDSGDMRSRTFIGRRRPLM